MDQYDENMDAVDPMSAPPPAEGAKEPEREAPESEKALVKKIIAEIRKDKQHFKKDFKRMREDMQIAAYGADDAWRKNNYTANITGRHIRQKTAALYAKNPKIVAERRETMDFMLWDETQESLMQAMQMVQQGQMMMAATPPTLVQDPMTGMVTQEPPPPPPGFEQAMALIDDVQQGMTRRQELKKFGKTLEILFNNAMWEQKPLDFKSAMKQVVRRACTTGVGYAEIGFQRETGPRTGMESELADFKARLDHLRVLAQDAAEGEIEAYDAEMKELEASLAALQAEPEVVMREGLIFDFPQSTMVIPDRACTLLTGFVGAGHLTVEYHYSKKQIREMFSVDLGKCYTPYSIDDKTSSDWASSGDSEDDGQYEMFVKDAQESDDDLCCLWKYYDKKSGLMYLVVDGYHKFIREPSSPDVFVEDFWPVYALTFNEIESEKALFPPSDVSLLADMQKEYNRSRQGKREHRQAARPRWGYANGSLTDENMEMLKASTPFDAIPFDIDPSRKIADILQEIPVPGVDPNLYDTNEVWSDMQVVVGTSQAVMGGLAKATATEASISANSSASADGLAMDDLDTFLTAIARASSQILMREMSEEQVKKIAGIGAVWPPQQSLTSIYEELSLKVEAGSTGKPNQAVEVDNWTKMMPFLLQIPGLKPEWLGRQTLRRLDDKADLTEALVEGLPSIMAMNAQKQIGTGDPATDPNAQGPQGGDNATAGQAGTPGSEAAFGSNQV